jgi:glycosyltransferase involved in cell wall biosynthesis
LIKKSVLIFKEKNSLKPVGGSSGYLYNMKLGLDSKCIKDVEFIEGNELSINKNGNFLSKIWKNIPEACRKKISNMLLFIKIIKNNYNLTIDISKYDIIHFHSTLSLYLNIKNLKYFKGIILLTSHSPKPWHKEVIEDQLTKVERILYSPFLSKLERVDELAFLKADYLVFPCEEAEEPYDRNWNKYEDIKKIKRNNFKYIPTGINQSKVLIEKYNILNKYNIPLDSFVICYVGRHNETKGYDLLKKLGKEILDKYQNVYFLVAGKEDPLKGLDHHRWIEVGWTNDPHSIINASDIFILPNKETYFDMIMLEVLSLGKAVIASYTGGNKYFERYKNHSIKLYNEETDAIRIIETYVTKTKIEVEEDGNKNYSFYLNEFTLDIFISKYIDMINNL